MALSMVCVWVLALQVSACKRRTNPDDEAASAPAERIVSFAPSLTEIAVDLELSDALVGASTFDAHPAVADLPRVGGMADPNLELLVALEPDLVLLTPSVVRVASFVDDEMPETRTVVHEIDTLDELTDAYRALGRAAGIAERAEQRADTLRDALDALTVPLPDTPPSVLLVVYRQPGTLDGLVAAGPGTFLDELLTRAGARNALPDDIGPWPTLGRESLLAITPDHIVELAAEPPDDSPVEVWREHLPSLRAVRDGRVARLTGAHLLLPGPRVVETLRDLRRVLSSEF